MLYICKMYSCCYTVLKKWYNILFYQPTNNTLLQLFRYCFVAVGAFAADYGCYFLLSYILGVNYLLSAVFGFVVGTLVNYVISKIFVFKGTPKSRVGEIALVFVIGGIGLVLLEVGLYLLTDMYGIHYLVSKLIMTAIVFFWNFFARKIFMYSHRFFNILKD